MDHEKGIGQGFPELVLAAKKSDIFFLTAQIAGLLWNHSMRPKENLVNGTSVVIFPEGTRSESGQIGTFKKGAFKLAIDLGLPILPITILNTKNILPAGTIDLRPGKVSMIIHKPIDIHDYNEESIKVLMNKAWNIIGSPFNVSINH